MRFEASSWDGSDFFVPANQGMILVTERVRTRLYLNEVTNLELERFTDIVIGHEIVRSLRRRVENQAG
jgi:hypothetical protein